MGSLERRIQELEGRVSADAVQGPSESFTRLKEILNELAALKASCANGFRGGVEIEPENIPRQILGPGYTHGELLELAVSRTVEAGKAPAERAPAYLDYLRELNARQDRDLDAVVEWERHGD